MKNTHSHKTNYDRYAVCVCVCTAVTIVPNEGAWPKRRNSICERSALDTALWLHSCKCLFLFTVFRNSIMLRFELAASISKLIFPFDFGLLSICCCSLKWNKLKRRNRWCSLCLKRKMYETLASGSVERMNRRHYSITFFPLWLCVCQRSPLTCRNWAKSFSVKHCHNSSHCYCIKDSVPFCLWLAWIWLLLNSLCFTYITL